MSHSQGDVREPEPSVSFLVIHDPRCTCAGQKTEYTYLLHLHVLFLNEVVVAQTHLAVACNVRVSVCNGLHKLVKSRRRLNEASKRDTLLQ